MKTESEEKDWVKVLYEVILKILTLGFYHVEKHRELTIEGVQTGAFFVSECNSDEMDGGHSLSERASTGHTLRDIAEH